MIVGQGQTIPEEYPWERMGGNVARLEALPQVLCNQHEAGETDSTDGLYVGLVKLSSAGLS